MAQSKFKNQFNLEEAIGRCALTILIHPFDYFKILVQLGYEPISPKPVKTIFGTTRLAYPSVFTYLGYIKKRDGFFGLYRGLTYKITNALITGYVHTNTMEFIKSIELLHEEEAGIVHPKIPSGDDDDDDESVTEAPINERKIRMFLEDMLRETTCRFISLSVSYPFQLLTIRTCASFVDNGPSPYDTFIGAINDVYTNGGVLGFYAGFTPRFLGDCFTLWLGNSLIFILQNCFDAEKTVKGYATHTINYFVSSMLYPFNLISTVMCVNGSSAKSLAASQLTGPEFSNWIQCWAHLSRMGQLKRGSAFFRRYTTGTIRI